MGGNDLLGIPAGAPPALDHERLEVYQVARGLTRAVAVVIRKVPRGEGHADSLDDLRRAVKSVTHNITEGSGEFSPADKAKFYRYARRSASECAGSLDHLVDFRLIREEDTWPAKWLVHRVISMLVKLLQSLSARAARESARPGSPAPRRPRAPSPPSPPSPPGPHPP